MKCELSREGRKGREEHSRLGTKRKQGKEFGRVETGRVAWEPETLGVERWPERDGVTAKMQATEKDMGFRKTSQDLNQEADVESGTDGTWSLVKSRGQGSVNTGCRNWSCINKN